MKCGETIQGLRAELDRLKRELDWRQRVWPDNLELASRVHQSLLPKALRHPKIDVDVRYQPLGAISSNYCQVIFSDDSHCYMAMCDVTGKGMAPALLATTTNTEVRHMMAAGLRPAEIARQLDEFICEHYAGTELLVSFIAIRLDLDKPSLTYSGAGHPAPILIHQQTKKAEAMRSQNLILGVGKSCLSSEPETTLEMAKGDRLLLFTDAIIQTPGSSGEPLGLNGLARIASITCAGDFFESAQCILNQLDSFRVGPVEDDILLILAELK